MKLNIYSSTTADEENVQDAMILPFSVNYKIDVPVKPDPPPSSSRPLPRQNRPQNLPTSRRLNAMASLSRFLHIRVTHQAGLRHH